MKRLMTLVAAASLALGMFTLPGCESNDQAQSDMSGSYAGGNGAFGEDPVSPGVYANTHSSHAAETPTTQPSAGG
jgi:hypothetical protein